jgi:hypothetical protein
MLQAPVRIIPSRISGRHQTKPWSTQLQILISSCSAPAEKDNTSLNLWFYYSTQSSIFGEALQNEKYKSARVNVL